MSEAIATAPAPTAPSASPAPTPVPAAAPLVKATALATASSQASPIRRFATFVVFAISILGGVACGMVLLFRNPDAASRLGFGRASGVTLITQHPDEAGQVLGVHVMAEQVRAAEKSVVIMGGRLRHGGMVSALIDASKRGIPVVVILHEGPGLAATRRALLEQGNVQVFVTQKEFDDQIALIDESRVFVSGLAWSKSESQNKIGALTSSSDPGFVAAARSYLTTVLGSSRKAR